MDMAAHDHPRRSLLRTIGHYADPALPFFYVINGVWAMLITEKESAITVVVSVLLSAAFFFGLFADLVIHRGSLCELCAAATPLNGAEKAERHLRTLRMVHYWTGGTTHYRLPLRLFGLMSGTLALNALTGLLVDPPKPYGSMLLFVTFTLPMAVFSWGAYRHNRLHPWCPYCDWRGGGDKETVVAPGPAPVAS